MNPGLRRLTRDVPNPAHDRRRRYGGGAVATYEAGSVFEYAPGKSETWHGVTYQHPGRCKFLRFYADASVCMDLLAASEPHTPTTWAEVVLERGYDNPEHFALNALERMMSDGSLTVDRARAIVAEILGQG